MEEVQNSLKEFYPKTFDDRAEKYFWYLKLLRVTLVTFASALIIILGATPVFVYLVYDEITTPIPIASFLLKNNLKFTYPLLFLWSLSVIIQSICLNFFFDMMTFTIFSAVALEWETLSQNFREFSKK
jgi:hypothetical protein